MVGEMFRNRSISLKGLVDEDLDDSQDVFSSDDDGSFEGDEIANLFRVPQQVHKNIAAIVVAWTATFVAFGLISGYVGSTLISLGLPSSLAPVVFVAEPVGGIFIQPWLGDLFDASRSQVRMTLYAGTALWVSVLMFAVSTEIHSLPFAVVSAALMIVTGNTFMYLIMACIPSILPPLFHAQTHSTLSVTSSIAYVVVYTVGSQKFGFPGTTTQIGAFFVVSSIYIGLAFPCLGFTKLRVTDPLLKDQDPGVQQEDFPLLKALRSIFHFPRVLQACFAAQFCCYFTVTTIDAYFSAWVATAVFQGEPGTETYDDGVRFANLAFGASSVCMGAASLLLPLAEGRGVDLALLWAVSNLLTLLALGFAVVLPSKAMAVLSMAAVGTQYATTNIVPWSFVTRACAGAPDPGLAVMAFSLSELLPSAAVLAVSLALLVARPGGGGGMGASALEAAALLSGVGALAAVAASPWADGSWWRGPCCSPNKVQQEDLEALFGDFLDGAEEEGGWGPAPPPPPPPPLRRGLPALRATGSCDHLRLARSVLLPRGFFLLAAARGGQRAAAAGGPRREGGGGGHHYGARRRRGARERMSEGDGAPPPSFRYKRDSFAAELKIRIPPGGAAPSPGCGGGSREAGCFDPAGSAASADKGLSGAAFKNLASFATNSYVSLEEERPTLTRQESSYNGLDNMMKKKDDDIRVSSPVIGYSHSLMKKQAPHHPPRTATNGMMRPGQQSTNGDEVPKRRSSFNTGIFGVMTKDGKRESMRKMIPSLKQQRRARSSITPASLMDPAPTANAPERPHTSLVKRASNRLTRRGSYRHAGASSTPKRPDNTTPLPKTRPFSARHGGGLAFQRALSRRMPPAAGAQRPTTPFLPARGGLASQRALGRRMPPSAGAAQRPTTPFPPARTGNPAISTSRPIATRRGSHSALQNVLNKTPAAAGSSPTRRGSHLATRRGSHLALQSALSKTPTARPFTGKRGGSTAMLARSPPRQTFFARTPTPAAMRPRTGRWGVRAGTPTRQAAAAATALAPSSLSPKRRKNSLPLAAFRRTPTLRGGGHHQDAAAAPGGGGGVRRRRRRGSWAGLPSSSGELSTLVDHQVLADSGGSSDGGGGGGSGRGGAESGKAAAPLLLLSESFLLQHRPLIRRNRNGSAASLV